VGITRLLKGTPRAVPDSPVKLVSVESSRVVLDVVVMPD
jgi:hypothetical protein